MGRGPGQDPGPRTVTAPVFRPAAAADIEDAYRWYENQRKGLGDQFLDAVTACVEAVQRHPERFPVLHRDTRRALLRRFPYGLFYRIHGDTIIVVACFHVRRRPRVWRTRR